MMLQRASISVLQPIRRLPQPIHDFRWKSVTNHTLRESREKEPRDAQQQASFSADVTFRHDTQRAVLK
jgi:hypothetical protein